jgi:hypothetical protein
MIELRSRQPQQTFKKHGAAGTSRDTHRFFGSESEVRERDRAQPLLTAAMRSASVFNDQNQTDCTLPSSIPI